MLDQNERMEYAIKYIVIGERTKARTTKAWNRVRSPRAVETRHVSNREYIVRIWDQNASCTLRGE